VEPDVQRIVDRILKDANERARSIVDEARKSAEMLLESHRGSARQRAVEDGQSLLKKAESEVEAIRGRVIADSKRKAGWLVLSEKENLITSVLNEVKSKLKNLPKSEKYLSTLEKMIIDAGTVLGGGELEVRLNEADSALPWKVNKMAKAITDKTGVKTKLRLSKESIDAVGAVVRTADNRIVLDNTFEAMLERREKEMRLKIAKIMFGNE